MPKSFSGAAFCFIVLALFCGTARSQTPTHEELCSLQTSSGALYGTRLLPDTTPLAIVVFHAGSGPTDRDGNTPLLAGKNDGLKQLAQALALHGIASLRYDKRGVAQSRAAMSNERDLRLDTYASDLAAWVRQLRADPRFNTIILAGHSEGSLVGMLAAQQVPVEGFVSIAGPSQRASRVLREQLRPQLTDGQFAQLDQSLREIEAGATPQTMSTTSALLIGLFGPDALPYLISWVHRDPAEEIAKMRVPVLIVQGTLDECLPPTAASELHQALPSATLAVIANMHHTLKEAPATEEGQRRAWFDPATPLSSQFVDVMEAFVLATQSRTKP